MRPGFLATLFLATLLVSASLPLETASAASLFDLLDTMGAAPSKDAKHKVEFVEGDKEAQNEILLIKISGVIQEADDSDRYAFEVRKDPMEAIRKDVECALERPEVKAVLLEVDSPGGEVTASDIIHHKLGKITEKDKPIVALIGSMGCSGAYYVSCAATKIMAHPTSVVGSIGVLMQAANLEKLAQLVGYRSIMLKSDRTPKKDVLSPFREMTPEERTMLLSIIDALQDRFLEIVSKNRGKPVSDITKLADGSIYTASQALTNGLIDGIGYREDALAKIRELAKIDTAKLVKRKARKGIQSLLTDLMEARSGVPAMLEGLKEILSEGGTPKLLFQLKPASN